MDKKKVVVIGSGIGGLTTGAFFSRAGYHVTVLEQHTKVGGYAHSFKRRGYRFESGIHSVPMSDNGFIMYLLRLLGIEDRIETVKLPEMYRVVSPDLEYTMPCSKEEVQSKLIKDFPHEEEGLKRFFSDLETFYSKIMEPLYGFEDEFIPEDMEFVSRFHNVSYQEQIEKFITDEELKRILFSQWPYGGAPENEGGALFYTMMYLVHYFEGAYTVKGGFSKFAEVLAGYIKDNGGEVLTKHRVVHLATDNRRVYGVEVKSGEYFPAEIVISNISPYELYHNRIIDKDKQRARWKKRLNNLNPSLSAVTVYLGLKPGSDMLPENSTNFYYFESDYNAIYEKIKANSLETDHLILLKCLLDPEKPVVTLMQFISPDASEDWKDTKMRVADQMIQRCEELLPGFSDQIAVKEVASPETFYRYTSNTGGAVYGFENTKDIYREAKLPMFTQFDNMFQTGHWGKPGCGIINVMFNGYSVFHFIRDRLKKDPLLVNRKDRPSGSAPAVSGQTKKRLRFIYPRFRKFLEGHEELREVCRNHLVGDYSMPPSLALPILASITPDEFEISLTDDNVGQRIDYEEETDLVVISAFTPQAQRAYEIADEYRRRGTKVIIGGIHASGAPEETKRHADSVGIGEAELVWGDILNDMKKGELKEFYKGNTDRYNLKEFPIPKREIFPRDVYTWEAHLVLTTRGCPVRCEGCPVPHKEGIRLRMRPVECVIEDIKSMPYKEFYVIDDTVMIPGKKSINYMKKFTERTKDLDVSIFLSSTMMMVSDPEFYRALKKGGVSSMYTVFGFDRASKALFSKDCTKEEWQSGVDLVRMIEDAGIHFFASYGIGFDDQDEGTPDRILKFSEEAGIDLAEFYIHTPFPGTPFGDVVEKEDRVLHRNYHLWNTGNVVFRPKHFTPDGLQQAFYYLWNEFYKDKVPQRTLRSFELNKRV